MRSQVLKMVHQNLEFKKPSESSDFGSILSSYNLISHDQLVIAREEQKNRQISLREALILLGFVSEQTMNEVVSQQGGFQSICLQESVIDHALIQQLPKSVAEQRLMIPITMEGEDLSLAVVDVYDIRAIDQARKYFPAAKQIKLLLATASQIQAAIDRYYGYDLTFDKLLQEMEGSAKTQEAESSWRSPVVRFVESVILNGIKLKASDIHFQPEENFVRLRYRIDGVLKQHCAFHKSYWSAVCVRLKIISSINIAESRRPQHGRFTITHGLRKIDFRVSCHPTVQGESIVLRILDQAQGIRSLEELGFDQKQVMQLQKIITHPQGLFIITGPTGSGKTTTMYSLLQYLNSAKLNIMTLEQPVEYQLPMIRQSEIYETGTTTFAEGIRSILRQDPDILFIGEIRDEETAQMALRAAMTGHLVFTTLHTNDCMSVLPRLKDLGLRSSMVAPYLLGVMSQRLVRLLCTQCKIVTHGTAQVSSEGCSHCHYTGFAGRLAVAEILEMTDPIQEAMTEEVSLINLREIAVQHGFKSFHDHAEQLILEGKTTREEVDYHLGQKK